MAIPLGRVSERSQSTEPADLLIECHDRIRQHMRGAQALAAAASGDPAIAPTAAAVHRYFHVALPLHSADEDVSVAPRLMDVLMCPGLEKSVADMTKQHVQIEATVERLLPLWQRLSSEPGAIEEIRATLAVDTERLDALWAEHLDLEEHVVFPLIAERLDQDVRAQIVGEMRGRRKS
jgi:hemerythrin-like domain-containing protein